MKQEWLEKNMFLRGMTQLPNLLLDYYRELSMNETELTAVLHLLRFQQKSSESKAAALSDYLMECMGLSRGEVNPLIFNMLSKGYFQTASADMGKTHPGEISLLPLYEKLTQLFSRDLLSPQDKSEREQKISQHGELVAAFEQVFRKLTSFDYEKIKEWLENDGWPPEIILEALRQAALQRKLSFAYIDRILLNWQINQWDTLEKIRAADEAFQRRAALRTQANQQFVPEVPTQETFKNEPRKTASKSTAGKVGKKKRYEDIVE